MKITKLDSYFEKTVVCVQEERGRSMVEMLGVLAIIGVLSIGAIAGYSTAMKRHRLNEIMRKTTLLLVDMNTNVDLNENWGRNYLYMRDYINSSVFAQDLKNTSGVYTVDGNYVSGAILLNVGFRTGEDKVNVVDFCEYVKSVNDLYDEARTGSTLISGSTNCQAISAVSNTFSFYIY